MSNNFQIELDKDQKEIKIKIFATGYVFNNLFERFEPAPLKNLIFEKNISFPEKNNQADKRFIFEIEPVTDFDDQMRNTEAVRDEITQIIDKIKTLASQTRLPVKQVAEDVELLLRVGFSIDKSISILSDMYTKDIDSVSSWSGIAITEIRRHDDNS